MITKNTFKIHILFYVVAFVCFVTGNFKDFIIFMSIILFHELGHVLVALYFKWNIEKIILLPFGGITIFKESFNRPIYEEFAIAIAGPIFQVSLLILFKNPIFVYYNLLLLGFNLLPIVPLDGSKIFNLFCNKVFPFYKSLGLTLYTSLLVLCVLFIMKRVSLLFLCVLFFLLVEIIKQQQRKEYYFQKFLLERYLYSFPFKKEKTITNIKNIYRDYRHIFKIDKKYYTERKIIAEMFDKTNKTC